ncbi:MAG: CHAT domain-containing tetratricopeptide repeat protein [Cyclobacteriaceae bacterium]
MKRISFFILYAGLIFQTWSQPLPSLYETLGKHYIENNFQACILLEKQVQTFAHKRLDTLASNSFFYLGDAFNQVGNVDKALTFFELERETLSALSLTETDDYSNSLHNLAYLYLQTGNYSKAGLTADELLITDKKIYSPTDDKFLLSVRYVADIYLQLDRLKETETLLLITLKAQPKNSVSRAVLLNKLGDLYSYTGEFTKASKALLEAIDILGESSGEETSDYLSTAISLGVLYMNQGKYPEAEEIFDVALSKMEQSEIAYAATLNNQALVLQSLGQIEGSEKLLLKIKTLDSLSVGTSHPDYAITLSNLGLVYADLGKFIEATQVLLQSLAIQENNQEGNTISYARKLNNLAKVHQMAGVPQKAVPLFEKALAIFKKRLGKESPEYATTAYNLGVAIWKMGEPEAGFRYLKLSAKIRAKVLGKKHPKYAESVLKIAEYEWYKNEVDNAQRSFGEVFENFYYQIDETFPVLTEEEKSKFYYTNIKDSFDKFNSFAVTHHHENPSLKKDVYDYLINTKAAIMLATEKVKTSIRSSGDSSLIHLFDVWQSQKEQIAKLYSTNQEQSALDSLLRSANILEKELTRKSAIFAGQFIRKKISWQEIQKTLKSGEAAVEVLRFKNYSPLSAGAFSDNIGYAFLIITEHTKAEPELVILQNGKELETKFLKFYRNSVQFNLSDPYSYKNYFQPLADYLKKESITRVFFSPDGVFNQININTIQNPFSQKYLIEEYDIRLVTNTRELVEGKKTLKNNQSSILIGYPKFNLDEVELYHQNNKLSTRSSNISTNRRGGLLRYMRGEGGISPLPGTQIEIQKISKLFSMEAKVFMENKASEATAKNVESPPILHIATHGFFLEDDTAGSERRSYIPNPLLNAGLILAGAENFLKSGLPLNESGDDGILTAFEAMNLNLDQSDLVVLSACETGLGDVKNGEGVYGLQRAFKIAGARSIVMSLWNVDDEATQQLMAFFYEALLKSGDQHLAFRTAQLKVKETYPTPFYWGAFIMVGI